MSTSRLIYEVPTKKPSDFKNVHKYTSYYQVSFDKVLNLLIDIFFFSQKSIKTYFQAIIFINIETNYLVLVSAFQKD